MDTSQPPAGGSSRSARGRAPKEVAEELPKSGTPSRSTPRNTGGRYKDKFNALRGKYEEANTRHDHFERDLVKADDKLKKIQAECDLLLDALALAAPTQPSLIQFLIPTPEELVAIDPAAHPNAYPEQTWAAPPPPPPLHPSQAYAYPSYEYDHAPMEPADAYDARGYPNGHGPAPMHLEYAHELDADPRYREWDRHRAPPRAEEEGMYPVYDRSMYRANGSGMNGHENGNGNGHVHAHGHAESPRRSYYRELTPPSQLHHINGHGHGS